MVGRRCWVGGWVGIWDGGLGVRGGVHEGMEVEER